MFITDEDIKKISHLARIRVDSADVAVVKNDLNRILNLVEQLNEVDCSEIDDTIQYEDSFHEREDVAVPCDTAVMNNAVCNECNMFVVPKIVR